jgi:hypothetical protein
MGCIDMNPHVSSLIKNVVPTSAQISNKCQRDIFLALPHPPFSRNDFGAICQIGSKSNIWLCTFKGIMS